MLDFRDELPEKYKDNYDEWIAEVADYHPLASMQIINEFGHDTDSYAQVMGAILGAIHGKDVFPSDMRITVNTQMKKQFGQDVNTWLKLLENY